MSQDASLSDSGLAQQPSRVGKAKPGRTRASCISCRQNKQRCDANVRLPCKRCELYGIDCQLDAATIVSGVPARVQPPPQQRSFDGVTRSAASTVGEVAALSDALKEITERLKHIETGLEADRREGARSHGSTSSASSASFHFDQVATASLSTHPQHQPLREKVAGANVPIDYRPLAIVRDSMDKVDALSPGSDGSGTLWGSSAVQGRPKRPPEAISKGLVTLADCEAAFAFFRARIEPWCWTFDDSVDNSPLGVHSRSPFYFHAILCVAAYYNSTVTERSERVYDGLVSILNNLIAQHIFAPEPHLFNTDLLRALALLILYKPAQRAAFSSRGMTDPGRIEQASKINGLSSMMMHMLTAQVVSHIRMNDAATNFLEAISSPDADKLSPPPPPPVGDLRLWYRILSSDVHGSLQLGRSTVLDATDALKTTKKFAALKQHPLDVRHAATMELYGIIGGAEDLRFGSQRFHDVPQLNEQLDRWEKEWTPLLVEAQRNGDTLAYTAIQCLRQFCTVQVNASVFHRWQVERARSLAEDGEGRPVLDDADWLHLQKAVDAAQKMIFSLSLESKESGAPLRGHKWPENRNGFRPALRLDPQVVDEHKTSLDIMTCVAFVFPLILLVRMGSSGLMSCELEMRRLDYEAGCDLDVPQPLTTGMKLPRLIQLGASFLDSIAPRATHPAKKHAVLLQMILRTGLGENTPSPPEQKPLPVVAPQTTVMDGSPESQPAPSLDAWLWDTNAPSLPINTKDKSFRLPEGPSGANAGEALHNLLVDVDPFLFNSYAFPAHSTYPGGVDSTLSGLDWDTLQNSDWTSTL